MSTFPAFSVLYDCKLYISEVWTVNQIIWAIWRCHFGFRRLVLDIFHFFIIWSINIKANRLTFVFVAALNCTWNRVPPNISESESLYLTICYFSRVTQDLNFSLQLSVFILLSLFVWTNECDMMKVSIVSPPFLWQQAFHLACECSHDFKQE